MAFDLSNYEDVDTRIHKFWESNPNGRIYTEIVYTGLGENGQLKQVVMKAEVWKDKKDQYPDATDYAEEVQGATPVNRTSFIENCSTSAIGRALATLGMAKKGARPSTAEMTKAERVEVSAEPVSYDPWESDKLGTLEQALTAMGAVPECACNEPMKHKSGTRKSDGKPYSGFFCVNNSDNCKPLWDK